MTTGEAQRLLYAQDNFPVFQNRMYDSADAARTCARGNIRLIEDLTTGLVRNAAFDPELVHYDANYQNEQSNSLSFRKHLDWVAGLIETQMGQTGLIEVGCGKGTFLEMLANRGADITGFDPTYEGDSPRIEKHFFQAGLGLSGQGLILRHVLEHIPDPVAFLDQLRDANQGSGLIYIEVPCFDWICDNRAWFDIFYEHVNYFRLSDFDRIFGRVVTSGHCFGGQYLYVIADLSTLRAPHRDPSDTANFPDDFAPDFSAPAPAADGDAGQDVVWGGASKGVIYALLRDRAGMPIDAVIDINPSKQGKYLAGTGIRVSAPDDLLPQLPQTTRIFVMNPNYLDEIKDMSDGAFTYVQVGHD